MRRLESYGTAQNRKVYVRHGAPANNVFGVSFANLNVLAKEIKYNGNLAEQLWASGNYDARNLAGKVAEPQKMDATQLNRWVEDVNNYMHGGAVGNLAAQSPAVLEVVNVWTASEHEFIKHAGYCAVGARLKNNADAMTDFEVQRFLDTIANEIHESSNWARYGMNWALIAIGTYKLTLTEAAIKVAERIGKVAVNHGETGCKTPDAAPYIKKAAAHNRAMIAKRQAKHAQRARK